MPVRLWKPSSSVTTTYEKVEVPSPGKAALGFLAGVALRAVYPFGAGIAVIFLISWGVAAFVSNLEGPRDDT